MAFRRNFRSSGRSTFMRRRIRPRLNWRRADKPRQWQVGNFNLRQEINFDVGSTGPGAQEFFANQIAAPSTFLPDTSGDQRMLNTAIRRLEIGGLVWTSMFDIRVYDTNASTNPHALVLQSLLTLNNVDSNGSANGVDFPWGSNTPPIINQPGTAVENRDEPVRILDRWATPISSFTFGAPTGTLRNAPFSVARRSRSLRLRMPIKEDQALLFTFHGTVQEGTLTGDDTISLVCSLVGTIYYRYRV